MGGFFKRDKNKESSIYTQNSWFMDFYLDFCNWKNVVTVQTLKWNTCIAFHYKFSCSDYHQLQSTDYTPNTPSQAMHVWTHLKPPKPIAHLVTFLMHCISTMSIGGHPQRFGKWVKKGGTKLFYFYVKH